MGTGSTTYPSPNAFATPPVSNSSVSVATFNLQRAGLYVFNPSATHYAMGSADRYVSIGRRSRLGSSAALAGRNVRTPQYASVV